MFRYVALLWDVNCADQCALALQMERKLKAASARWELKFSCAGVKVLVADASRALGVCRLHGNAGVVLGEIFVRQTDIESDAVSRHAVFGARETRAMLESQGRTLTCDYWGNFVAVLVDAGAEYRYVVNDPTGPLPCYLAEQGGIRIVFSCLGDCFDLGLARFRVNWSFIRMRTVNGLFDVESEPLANISTVHRGECVRLDRQGKCTSRRSYWNPSTYADSSLVIGNPVIAETALRSTIRNCVHSLAAAHAGVLQQTSGGLDSSIVLGCLGDAPSRPDITCYTNYVADSVCDERRWARQAAKRRRCRHVEMSCNPAAIDFEDMPVLAPSVEPGCCFYHWQKGPLERRLAQEYGATATFTGEGGDAALCSTTYVYAVDAVLRRHGLGMRALRTAALVGARRDRTVWNVLASAVKRRWVGEGLREHRHVLSTSMQLVHRDARQAVERDDHFPNPWFDSTDHVPMETLSRLGTLAFPPNFYDLSIAHGGESPVAVSPLCAQPVVEICRRIPADIHFAGGRIRGLARRAFAGEVPEPILRRQWKDRPLSLVAQVIHRNIHFIREALLEGALVRERILDRAAVELALQNVPTRSRVVSGEILQHMDLELWIRHSA